MSGKSLRIQYLSKLPYKIHCLIRKINSCIIPSLKHILSNNLDNDVNPHDRLFVLKNF